MFDKKSDFAGFDLEITPLIINHCKIHRIYLSSRILNNFLKEKIKNFLQMVANIYNSLLKHRIFSKMVESIS